MSCGHAGRPITHNLMRIFTEGNAHISPSKRMLLLPVSSPLTSVDTAMFYILMVAVILSNMAEYVVLQLLVSCLNQ